MPERRRTVSITTDQARRLLDDLHALVSNERRRVYIEKDGETCVLMSAQELEALERAVEILSNTAEFQRVSRHIAAMVHSVAQGPLVLS